MSASRRALWAIGTQDVRSSLFPLAFSVDAYTHLMSNAAHIGIGHFGIVFDGSTVTYLMVDDEWRRSSRRYWNRIQERPALLTPIFRGIHSASDAVVATARVVARAGTPERSNADLTTLYRRYARMLGRVYAYGLVPTFLDFKQYTYVTDLVTRILHRHRISDDEQGSLFALLTTPTAVWDFTRAEDEMRGIIRQVQGRTVWRRIVGEGNASAMAKKTPALVNRLTSYRDQFGWLQYGYEGPAMTVEDVVQMLQERLKSDRDHSSIEKTLVAQHRAVQNNQQEAIRQYRFSPDEVRWFGVARSIAFYKSYRRLRQSQSYALAEPFLRLLADRCGVDLHHWRMMLPEEVLAALKDPDSLPGDLGDRRQCCVYGRARGKTIFYAGASAQSFVAQYVRPLEERQSPTLHGQVSYPGVMEGRAVIVRTPDDAARVDRGEIIISPSLNPHMQLAMERCRAIVTDAGGLTCHAAVVAREYQIPCIVGVRGASSTIKTGQRVRVDANHGIVTILSRK